MTERAYRSASLVQSHGNKPWSRWPPAVSGRTTPPALSTACERTKTSSTGTSSDKSGSTHGRSRSGIEDGTVRQRANSVSRISSAVGLDSARSGASIGELRVSLVDVSHFRKSPALRSTSRYTVSRSSSNTGTISTSSTAPVNSPRWGRNSNSCAKFAEVVKRLPAAASRPTLRARSRGIERVEHCQRG